MTIFGNPPTLEWVDIARLSIDPSYQRSVEGPRSRRIIVGMTKSWNWSLCQPLVVSRRADSALFVLDGQHRLTGARERKDILHLPCVILSGRSEQDEAATFVSLNTKRQKLSQADIFLGMLAAGDEEARTTAAILEDTGWRMIRSSNTQQFKAGDLACAPMLTRELKAKGHASVRNALAALREAYEEPVTQTATILEGLISIYAADLLKGCDPDHFIASLGFIEPRDWKRLAIDTMAGTDGLSRREAMVKAIMVNFENHLPQIMLMDSGSE